MSKNYELVKRIAVIGGNREALPKRPTWYTKAITQLRKDKKTALGILKDYPEIKEKIRIEEQMRQGKDAPNKNRKRGYER